MHHTTVATQAHHGKSFNVKGLIESNHAGELISDEEFAKLKVSDVKLTRTSGGGFEYEVEFAVTGEEGQQTVSESVEVQPAVGITAPVPNKPAAPKPHVFGTI